MNDIKIIKNEDKKFFKNAKVGDYLLSLHTINALVLVDHKTLKVKWYLRDEFRRQHSPNITKDGMLLIFDNKGSDKRYGESRVIQFDLANKNFDTINASVTYSTLVELDKSLTDKKKLEEIILVKIPNEIYPELRKVFIFIFENSGFRDIKIEEDIDFKKLYLSRKN